MSKNITGSTVKKVLSIAGNVVLYVVVAFALFVLIVSITAKKDDTGTATVFGKQLRFVRTESMEACDRTDVSAYKIKSIKMKSCVFIDVIPEDEAKKEEWLKSVKVGDVLTFKYPELSTTTPITHRVIEIEQLESGGYKITLAGDNKNSKDGVGKQVIADTSDDASFNYVIGRVTGQSYLLGLLVYAFRQPVGIVCLIIVPCLIIIAFQVIRIVMALNADKAEKVAAENATRTNEIEELKRQLAALQKMTAPETSVQAEVPAEQSETGADVQSEEEGAAKSDEPEQAESNGVADADNQCLDRTLSHNSDN